MFRKIAAVQVLSGGAFLASFTFIPIYARELGMSNLDVSVMAALYGLCSFSSAYTFGRMADKKGKRLLLRIGLISASVFCLTQALSWNFPSITLFRMMAGVGFGMFPAALAAYAFEAKAKMGKFSAFGALGWALSLPLSGYVADLFTVPSVFILASLLLFLAFVLSSFFPRIKEARVVAPRIPIGMMIRNRTVLLPTFLRHAAASSIWVLWPIFLHERLDLSLMQIGTVQATNAITQFATMYLAGDRLPPKASFSAGLVLTSIAALSFTIIDTYPLFLLTQVLLGMSWAFMYVGALRWILDTNIERASSAGLLTSTISFSGLFGPFISIAIVALLPGLSYLGPMYFAAAVSLAAFILSVGSYLVGRAKSVDG